MNLQFACLLCPTNVSSVQKDLRSRAGMVWSRRRSLRKCKRKVERKKHSLSDLPSGEFSARISETGGTQSMSRIEGNKRVARLEKGK